ncbi:putative antireceptor [Streptococcus pneumoniae]|nr:putative antireceptor [Streptococcus pneumoniae]
MQGARGEQGIPGPRGADGRTQYTHMAYADNATGGGFSQTNTTKPLLGCTLTLIQQTAEILLIIAGQDGKVVMAQMAWQVGLVQMVGHHTYT